MRINRTLLRIGFKRSSVDPCLYIKPVPNGYIYILVYVDDLLSAAPDRHYIDEVLCEIAKEYPLNVVGDLQQFLGFSIQYSLDEGFLRLRMPRYTKDIITRFGQDKATPVSMPISNSVIYSVNDPSLNGRLHTDYRGMVGSLIYLSVTTRPDLAYAMSIYSRMMSAPTYPAYTGLKSVFRYLKGTFDKGITYTRSTKIEERNVISCYVDADFARDIDSRRSQTGYVIYMNGGPVLWCSKRQSVTALSTAEAEYRALAAALQDVLFLRNLLNDMGCPQVNPTTIYEDNDACRQFATANSSGSRLKHLEIPLYFIKDHTTESKSVELIRIDSKENIGDIFTKPLVGELFAKHCSKLVNSQLHNA